MVIVWSIELLISFTLLTNLSFSVINNFNRFAAIDFRDVAQPGSAHVWGAWGRKFESCHPDTAEDQNPLKASKIKVLLVFYPHFISK